MLKASALVYAIIIALISGVLSGSIVLFAYLNSLHFEALRQKEKLIENVESGINLLLSRQSLVLPNNELHVDLFGSGIDSVRLKRKSWGVFEVISVSADWKGTRNEKNALVGITPEPLTCFYLCEEERPLSVCGKTLLKGTCFLPSQGIRTTYMEGKSFIGDKPVEGLVMGSQRALPEYNKELFEYLGGVLMGNHHPEDSVVVLGENELPDSLNMPFSEPTVILSCKSSMRIPGISINGNVCIWSPGRVIIAPEAKLDQVTIFAREIVVETGFSGAVQLFASDSILLKKHVKLNYPSAVGVVRIDRSPPNIGLIVDKEVSIHGDVFVYEERRDMRKQTMLSLGEGDTIAGQVFSNGILSLKGNIWGVVSCSRLLLNVPSGVYENHLLDVQVDRKRLSQHYCGMDIWKRSGNRKIAAWLN